MHMHRTTARKTAHKRRISAYLHICKSAQPTRRSARARKTANRGSGMRTAVAPYRRTRGRAVCKRGCITGTFGVVAVLCLRFNNALIAFALIGITVSRSLSRSLSLSLSSHRDMWWTDASPSLSSLSAPLHTMAQLLCLSLVYNRLLHPHTHAFESPWVLVYVLTAPLVFGRHFTLVPCTLLFLTRFTVEALCDVPGHWAVAVSSARVGCASRSGPVSCSHPDYPYLLPDG